jgi:hypothetical protein
VKGSGEALAAAEMPLMAVGHYSAKEQGEGRKQPGLKVGDLLP